MDTEGVPPSASGEPRDAVSTVARADRLLSGAETVDDHGLAARAEVEPFVALAAPLIEDAAQRLGTRLATLVADRDAPLHADAVVDSLLRPLGTLIAYQIRRTCVLELNVARVEERLSGDTPEARHDSFIALLRDPGYRQALFAEYRVLLHRIAQRVEQWVEASLELAQRFTSDFQQLTRIFGELGTLTGVVPHLGDFHRGGRSVAALHFDNGQRLIYKPRSVAAEARFQDLLAWCNDRGAPASLKTLRVVDCGQYGWVEAVRHTECQNAEQVDRFYRRTGALLALVHALHGSDLHHENIIACGEHPVVLDLEALFHPLCASNDGGKADLPHELRAPTLVTHTALLPRLVGGHGDKPGIDMSGLGAMPGQELPFGKPETANRGTDRAAIRKARKVTEAGHNLPVLDGEPVSPQRHLDALHAGFAATYRLLLRHREELLAADGPIAAFADCELRRVVRLTQVYMLLHAAAAHPDYQRDPAELDELWQRLHTQAQHDPWLEQLIPHEIADLERGDVPFFTTGFDERRIYASNGEPVAELFRESPHALARHQIANLNEQALAAQIWVMDAVMSRGRDSDGQYAALAPRTVNADRASNDVFADEARRIGDHLIEHRLTTDCGCFWACPVLDAAQRRTNWSSFLPELYNGQLGIVLLLGYLGNVLDRDEYRDVAYAGLRPFRLRLAAGARVLPSAGAFSGSAGYVYVLSHLGHLYNDAELLDEAAECLPRIVERLEQRPTVDVIEGAAGCILALESLLGSTQGPTAAHAMQRCAQQLASTAVAQPTGLGWVSEADERALTGMSHGAAGVAAALAVSATALDRPSDADLAREALTFENSQFDASHGNWRDLRAPPDDTTESEPSANPMAAWCHGAPGIGLARARSLDGPFNATTRTQLENDIDTAVEATLRSGFAGGHSLCHGSMGNLDCLLFMAQRRHDEVLHQEVQQHARAVVAEAAGDRWRCGMGTRQGLPAGWQVPGLMTGLAGIGYALLRLAAPERVPSVLALEAPVRGELTET